MHRVTERLELTFIGCHGVGLVPLQLLEDAAREKLHVDSESWEETEPPLPQKEEMGSSACKKGKTYRNVIVQSIAILVFLQFHTLYTRMIQSSV